MRFADKVAVVTGASSGIGFAAARALAAEGAVVAVNDVRPDAAQAAVDKIVRSGGSAFAVAADASDGDAVEQAVRKIMDREGRIDILVNNAGIFANSATEEMAAAEWRKVLSINLDGPFFWSQSVAAASMLPRRSGAIVNVASLAGLISGPRIAAYTASKHGLVGLTKALAVEWGPFGIRVNAICPGFTETDMVAAARASNPEMFAERVGRIPLGIAATADDQANAILFLASDQAAAIAGLAMNIDGGTLAMASGFSVVRP